MKPPSPITNALLFICILANGSARAPLAKSSAGNRAFTRNSSLRSLANQRTHNRGPLASRRRPSPKRRTPWVISIPALSIKQPVEEGVGNWETLLGPAHEPGSSWPGEDGNCIIAGHRNMGEWVFVHLPRLKPGAKVYFVSPYRRAVYRIDWSEKVSVNDTAPLDDTDEPTLTLYTCVLPFNENRRWVAQGHLIE